MNKADTKRTLKAGGKGGYTLAELMMSVVIFVMIMAGALTVYIMFQNSYVITNLQMKSSNEASGGIERLVYGWDPNPGLRAVIEDSVSLTQYGNGSWKLNYSTDTISNRWVRYQKGPKRIRGKSWIAKNLITNVTWSTANITNNGIQIMVRVENDRGRRSSESEMTTFIKFRN